MYHPIDEIAVVASMLLEMENQQSALALHPKKVDFMPSGTASDLQIRMAI